MSDDESKEMEIEGKANEICEAGKPCMVAIFRIRDGKIHLTRVTKDYPLSDFQPSVDLFGENLSKESK